MDDLIAFVRARLSEDEAGIREALRTEDEWVSERDLIDIQAKRMLLDDAERDPDASWTAYGSAQWRVCVLAMPYRDHADYRPEWTPATEGE